MCSSDLEVLAQGGDAGARLNAADEVATAAFLDGRIPFRAITTIAEGVVRARPARRIDSLRSVQDADAEARALAATLLADPRITTASPTESH